jgi:hypothetical protein
MFISSSIIIKQRPGIFDPSPDGSLLKRSRQTVAVKYLQPLPVERVAGQRNSLIAMRVLHNRQQSSPARFSCTAQLLFLVHLQEGRRDIFSIQDTISCATSKSVRGMISGWRHSGAGWDIQRILVPQQLPFCFTHQWYSQPHRKHPISYKSCDYG